MPPTSPPSNLSPPLPPCCSSSSAPPGPCSSTWTGSCGASSRPSPGGACCRCGSSGGRPGRYRSASCRGPDPCLGPDHGRGRGRGPCPCPYPSCHPYPWRGPETCSCCRSFGGPGPCPGPCLCPSAPSIGYGSSFYSASLNLGPGPWSGSFASSMARNPSRSLHRRGRGKTAPGSSSAACRSEASS